VSRVYVDDVLIEPSVQFRYFEDRNLQRATILSATPVAGWLELEYPSGRVFEGFFRSIQLSQTGEVRFYGFCALPLESTV
jgi:hypothetical protein